MIVVTNNETARNAFSSVAWVDGTVLDVVDRAESMVRQGYFLVSSPLSANNRLNRSSYRSIMLGEKSSWSGDDLLLLQKARVFLESQRVIEDALADQDYRWIDAELTRTAWNDGIKLGLS